MKKILPILLVFLILSAAACTGTQPESDSPSVVLKTFIEAKQKKDAEAVKKTLSADSLKLYEDIARRLNTSTEALLVDNEGSILKDIPPMRNEKISGDLATVEAQVPQTGVWQKFPFVKETGGWKIAMDRILIESQTKGQEKVDETLKNLPKNAPEKGNQAEKDK